MADSGAAVAAETDPAAVGTQIQNLTVGTPEIAQPQGDEVNFSGPVVLSQPSAGQQPAACNFGGEDLGAAAKERDDSDQQRSPQGHTPSLTPMGRLDQGRVRCPYVYIK